MSAERITPNLAQSRPITPHGAALVDSRLPPEQPRRSRGKWIGWWMLQDRNALRRGAAWWWVASPPLRRASCHGKTITRCGGGPPPAQACSSACRSCWITDDERHPVWGRLLRTYGASDLAVMTVESRWEPDKVRERLVATAPPRFEASRRCG